MTKSKQSNPNTEFQNVESKLETYTPVRMPSSVKIVGKAFKIKYYDPSQGFQDHGQMNESTRTILIAAGQLPIDEADTVLHEVLHGIDCVFDLSLTEHQVRMVATALIGMFQDNPHFAEYLTQPLEPVPE